MLSNCGAGEDLRVPWTAVNPRGNQPWIFIGRTEAEALIRWPPDEKSWLIGKDPDVGKDWRQEEKRMAENEMVGRHHWLNGHELKQDLGDGEGYRETSYVAVHGVTKSWAWLNDWEKTTDINRHKLKFKATNKKVRTWGHRIPEKKEMQKCEPNILLGICL